jgi:hypothetical protein
MAFSEYGQRQALNVQKYRGSERPLPGQAKAA